jgi:GDPmannose 4,6-dehydratase
MGKQITWKGENINEVGMVDNKIVIKVSNKFYKPYKKEKEFDAHKRVQNWKPKYDLENIIFSVYSKK